MARAEDVLGTLRRVAEVLEALDVQWAVGGSFASSVHGEPRSTNDIDVIAALRLPHVPALASGLGDGFYLDTASIERAIADRGSFNVIDQSSIVKVDVFVPPPGALGEGQLLRRRRQELPGGGSTFVLSAEDIVLQKLRWYELGGRVSERQWRDLVAVLRSGGLDSEYLSRSAASAGLGDLLSEALREAS